MMQTLSAARLLDVWESGLRSSPDERSILLLLAVMPDKTRDEVHTLGIGERDYYLLQVRQMLFGSRMEHQAACPACDERLEWESDVADLSSAGEGQYPLGTALEMMVADCRIRFRPPNMTDIADVLRNADGSDTERQLLERCLIDASTPDGQPLDLSQLPATSVQVMSQRLEKADPLARIDIELHCPNCGHQWLALFDITSFLWAEINAWAERTLRAVDLLARTYGWQEADILAMTPTRRQIYVEMAEQ
jgi:hypothetical protein